MDKIGKDIFDKLLTDIPELKCCSKDIENAYETIFECYKNNGKIMICGNGGSAADCEHIVGELMKSFRKKRPISNNDRRRLKLMFPEEAEYFSDKLEAALPALSLVSQSAFSTAYINDTAPDMVFAQQVYGYGKKGDILIGMSTSGNSLNVINAVKVAKAFGIKIIGMTGKTGGKMKNLCDITIKVPSDSTYRIQEFHLPIYHALCAMIESSMFV